MLSWSGNTPEGLLVISLRRTSSKQQLSPRTVPAPYGYGAGTVPRCRFHGRMVAYYHVTTWQRDALMMEVVYDIPLSCIVSGYSRLASHDRIRLPKGGAVTLRQARGAAPLTP